MITYEFPLNEQLRTLLKLERLFQQALALMRMEDAMSHQAALLALFDLMEIASRNEVRQELLMELNRVRQRLDPIVDTDWSHQLDQANHALHELPAKLDHMTRDDEWLTAVRQRTNVPGGINGFDLPHFHHWQHTSAQQRRANLVAWISPALPVYQALNLILRRLRQNNPAKALIASGGIFQQMLNGRSGHLVRITLDNNAPVIPEVSANRHALNIRFTTSNTAGHTTHLADIEFQLCFCEI